MYAGCEILEFRQQHRVVIDLFALFIVAHTLPQLIQFDFNIILLLLQNTVIIVAIIGNVQIFLLLIRVDRVYIHDSLEVWRMLLYHYMVLIGQCRGVETSGLMFVIRRVF